MTLHRGEHPPATTILSILIPKSISALLRQQVIIPRATGGPALRWPHGTPQTPRHGKRDWSAWFTSLLMVTLRPPLFLFPPPLPTPTTTWATSRSDLSLLENCLWPYTSRLYRYCGRGKELNLCGMVADTLKSWKLREWNAERDASIH